MDNQSELRYRVIKAGALTGVLAFAAIGAGVSTFFGIKAMVPSAGVEGVVIPAVSAAVVSVGLFFIWHKMVNLIPLLRSPARQALGIGLALTLSVVTILISSWFIATSIGGPRAVQAYMNSYVASANAKMAHAVQNFSAEQSLIPTIENHAAGWRGQAKNELKAGSLSGRAGAGPIAATLNGAAADLEKLSANMQRTRQDFADLQEQAQGLLADLSKIANSADAATSTNQALFSETAGRFFQKLREMERLSLLPQVKLGGVVIVTTTAGGAISENLNNIQVTLDKQTRELQSAVKKIEGSRLSIDPLPYTPTNQGTATWEYASAVPGAWLVGIGIDLLPLLVLLLLMLTHAEAREPHVERTPFTIVDGGRNQRSVA